MLQTFSLHHSGDGYTWFHPTGSAARLDYIAVSKNLCSTHVRTQIASVDIALQRIDHLAVQADIPIDLAVCIDHEPHHSVCSPVTSAPGVPLSVDWAVDVHDMRHNCKIGCEPHSHQKRMLFHARATCHMTLGSSFAGNDITGNAIVIFKLIKIIICFVPYFKRERAMFRLTFCSHGISCVTAPWLCIFGNSSD